MIKKKEGEKMKKNELVESFMFYNFLQDLEKKFPKANVFCNKKNKKNYIVLEEDVYSTGKNGKVLFEEKLNYVFTIINENVLTAPKFFVQESSLFVDENEFLFTLEKLDISMLKADANFEAFFKNEKIGKFLKTEADNSVKRIEAGNLKTINRVDNFN